MLEGTRKTLILWKTYVAFGRKTRNELATLPTLVHEKRVAKSFLPKLLSGPPATFMQEWPSNDTFDCL